MFQSPSACVCVCVFLTNLQWKIQIEREKKRINVITLNGMSIRLVMFICLQDSDQSKHSAISGPDMANPYFPAFTEFK